MVTSKADVRFITGWCPLGVLLVAQTSLGVCSVLMGDGQDGLEAELRKRFPRASRVTDSSMDGILEDARRSVMSPGHAFPHALDMHGTDLQVRVWKELQTIPAGTQISYSALANRLGTPSAFRAVANACAANMLAVIVPCHRVVREKGHLAGYRWGIERKKKLLELEATTVSTGSAT